MLSTPSSSAKFLPPLLLDPRPAISHATSIADEACHLTGDHHVGVRRQVSIVISKHADFLSSRYLGTLDGHL